MEVEVKVKVERPNRARNHLELPATICNYPQLLNLKLNLNFTAVVVI
jgi:hypothetical protein